MTPSLLEDIQWFITEYDGSEAGTSTSYVFFEPEGTYSYAYRPSRDASSQVIDRISGPGVKRTAATILIRTTSRVPTIAKILPMFSVGRVSLPEKMDFDVAISSYRTRLIDHGDRKVWAFSRSRPEMVKSEIEARKSIPDSVNTPMLLETGHDPVYFVDQLIDGVSPPSLLKAPSWLCDTFEQIKPMFEESQRVVDVGECLEEVDLSRDPIQQFGWESIRSSFKLPENLYKGRVHGDLHADNVLLTDDGPYLLDWELSEIDYIIRDIFHPYFVEYHRTREYGLIDDLLDLPENHSRINSQISTMVSDHYASIRGLFLTFLLLNYRWHTREGLGDTNDELLTKLLSD